jgi:selenium metabolism protein YedF
VSAVDKETLDCRGLACPSPVVETKKKISTMASGTLTVLVDNDTARKNLLKLADSLNMEAVSREEDGLFAVTLLKEGPKAVLDDTKGKTLMVTADTLGRGNEDLGAILMKSFFYALSESDRLPEAVYLVNSGVKLACDGSPVMDSLGKLVELGVEVHSCGLCLDFFQLKENLRVGNVTNMYAIVEGLMNSRPIIL